MNKRFFVMNAAVGLCLWVIGAGNIEAQQSPAPSGPSVQVVVTVEAVKGSVVPEVGRDDVLVHEGHDRDKVTGWVPAQGDNAALDLVVLLDDASSFDVASQWDDLRKFITAQPASTKIGVAYMQNGSAKWQQNLTSDHALAAKSLRLPLGIRGVEGSPYFSLTDLVKHWPKSTARREVVVVSDGIDPYYGTGDLQDPYVSEAIDNCQKAGVIVFAIYFPGVGHYGHSHWLSYWGQLYLSEVAEKTGGESYYIGFNGPPVSISPYLTDVEHRLTRQYLLTFIPKPQKKSGLQRVKVMTEVKNAELVAAERVYVPAAEQ